MANARLKITELPKIVYYGINTHPDATPGEYNPAGDSIKSVHKDDELIIAVHDSATTGSTAKA